jgi:hypothetical protein
MEGMGACRRRADSYTDDVGTARSLATRAAVISGSLRAMSTTAALKEGR